MWEELELRRLIGPPTQGDLVEVHWVDIYENSVGDPTTASLARRISVGYFWEEKDDNGIPALVTTTTLEEDPHVSGFCIYPKTCVTELRILRRRRRGRKGKRDATVKE